MLAKTKKVLIVNTYFSQVGGSDTIAYDTYKLLKNAGYSAYFWASDKLPFFEPDYEYKEFFTKYNTSLLNYFSWYNNIKAQRDLNKFIDYIKPDIIHLHGFVSYLSPSILKCCSSVPTIVTLHDATFACPAVKLMYKDKEYCSDLKCRGGNYINCTLNHCIDGLEAQIRKTIRNYLLKSKLKYIDKYITPSDALRQVILNANIGIKEDKIVTVNNFLKVKDWNYEPNYKNKSYFLYVGRLSREKGVHYLLSAFKDLPKEINLHIIGCGSEEKKLKQFAIENNLDNVKFLGYMNREKIKEEYQNCISTILPCNWFEIFGMTNIESFINGKPVIASNIGGIPEIIESGKTGLLFEPANVKQLKDCILKYWNNPEMVIEHGKNGYQKVQSQYTEDNYYNKLINVYDGVLSK